MRIVPVVRREYLERVRSKAFLVSTILGPALMAAFTIFPSLIMTRQRGKPLKLAILDASGALGSDVRDVLARRKVAGQSRFIVEATPPGPVPGARDALRERVLKGDLDGYLFLSADVLTSSRVEYYGKNVSNVMDIGMMEQGVEEAVVGRRLTGAGLDVARVRDLTRRLDLKTVRLTQSGAREDRGGTFLLSMVLMMMLYTTLAMWGAAIMNGVIEEKANRVVEVVVSSLPPVHLFAGKLLGVGAAGLTQFLVWTGFLLVFGLYGATFAAGATLPEVSGLVMTAFVLYFFLGFFVYGSMYAAVGAAVNTQQEAQSLAFPVMMPLILSVVFFPAVLGSPDSTLAVGLSLVPFFAPILMFLRITAVTPPMWQIVLSLVLMLLAIAVLTWAASRIYRVGILMHGKRPTFPEILRWINTA